MLAKFDHPLLFAIAMVFVVTAGQKLLAYAAGKAGQDTMHKFFTS